MNEYIDKYSKVRLSRYFKTHPNNRFNLWDWFLHYTYIVRISYSTGGSYGWTTCLNIANPLSWGYVILGSLIVLIMYGIQAFQKEELKKVWHTFIRYYKKNENGNWVHLPYKDAPETYEESKKFLNQ